MLNWFPFMADNNPLTRKAAIERFFVAQPGPDADLKDFQVLLSLTQAEFEELLEDLLPIERFMENGDREILRVFYGPHLYCRFTWE